MKNNLILVEPTKEKNGILVKKTINNLNSCELRKISVSGRDNGYIASVNYSGDIHITGLSWRPKPVKNPIDLFETLELIKENLEEIRKIIKN